MRHRKYAGNGAKKTGRFISGTLLFIGLLIGITVNAQQITISENDAPLSKIFKKITEQTGVQFVYRDEWMKQTKNISISVKSAQLKDVLNICFNDQPYTYELIDKMVVLKEKKSDQQPVNQKQVLTSAVFKGRVIDTTGTPLTGANIYIKGSKTGTTSDVHGDFELDDVSVGTQLLITYTGFVDLDMTVAALNNYRYPVILKRSVNVLDEMIVQGYGTTSKRFNVGSIATVDASVIERQPVTNVLLALQGQVPGLAVNSMNGVPGANTLIQVRGQNTLRSNPLTGWKPYDQPLFIIDGVPFAAQNNMVSQLSNIATGGTINGGISQSAGIGAFNGINPADIESISILKDADATSIYGTQGSNGVILITTKKGKAGKAAFNVTVNSGFNSAAKQVKLMNTQQYLQLRTDAFIADGLTPSSSPSAKAYAPDLTIFDQNKFTDWQNVIYGKTSNNTDVHASVSGGSTNNTFLLSGGFTRSTFNYPGSFYDQRLTLHSAYRYISSNNRLTMDAVFDYGYDKNNSPAFGGGQRMLNAPNMPDLLDSAGNLVWNYKGVNLSSYQFYAYLKQPTSLEVYNLNTSLRLGYKVSSALSFTLNIGNNRNTNNEHSEKPGVAQPPASINRSAKFAANNLQTLNIEPQLDYNHRIGKGMLSALVGASYKKNTGYSTATNGSGYSNDNLLGSINGASSISSSDNNSIYKYVAVFGRIKYVYRQKYIVSVTGRRDGSSNFGPGKQFGNFGSIGGGWIFSEETAVKNALPFISFGKLSGSYGTSGSDGVAAYQYQPFWQSYSYLIAMQKVVPNIPQNLYNPNYSWAVKKSLNLSMDIGLLQNKVLLNATYYRNRESNQLGGYPLPSQAGFPSVLENLPADIQNTGWEFSFTSQNISKSDFTWTTNFNIAFNRNKLLSFPNLSNSPYRRQYIIGQPTSIIYGYQYKGVNPTTGLFEFYDRNGKATSAPVYGVASEGGDLVPIANREVKYMGGFGNTFTYKRLSFYVFLQFSSQTAPSYLATVYSSSAFPGVGLVNQPVAVLDRFWKTQGDNSELQRLFTGYSANSKAYTAASAFGQSSGVYVNDTYARVKTVSLSYALPDNWMKRIRVRDCKVFVNAQNLFTITNFKVADPETFGNYTLYPIQRTIVAGVNLNF